MSHIVCDSCFPVYIAQILLENPEKSIKPGMSCKAFIDFNQNQKSDDSEIILPIKVVSVTEENEYFVFVAENGKAKRKQVSTGKLYSNGIAITSGLKASDQVITSGYHKLTDNTPIKIAQ